MLNRNRKIAQAVDVIIKQAKRIDILVIKSKEDVFLFFFALVFKRNRKQIFRVSIES